MKNIFYIATLSLFASMAFANPPLTQNIIKYDIVVPANNSIGGQILPLPGGVRAIKVCLVDELRKQNMQLKASIAGVYVESISRDCSALESIDVDDPDLILGCRNFEGVQRTCKAKIVFYTKGDE